MPDLRRLVQRPGRVGQVRPRHRAQVGAAGGDDHVHVVGLEDGAHGHGGDADLVADAVGKRRLVHAAVDRLLLGHHLARAAVDDVGARGLEQAREGHRVIGRVAAGKPVVAAQPHRDRPLLRPGGADGGEHLQRPARAVLDRAAIGVAAPVGQRREKARQQVAVGAVQLQDVEAGVGRAPRGSNEVGADAVHVGAVSSPAALASSGRREWPTPTRAASCRTPAARRRAASRAGCCPCARRGRAGCPSWRRCGRARSRRCAARRRAARRSTGRRSPA